MTRSLAIASRALFLAALLASCVGAPMSSAPAATPTQSTAELVAPGATPADPCAGIQQANVPSGAGAPFPTRTAADVLRSLAADPYVAHMLEDVAGVRPGPLRDPRVPLCQLDAMSLAQPLFVRRVPGTIGEWLVPVEVQGEPILTIHVGLDANGEGRVSGSRGGGPLFGTGPQAMAAGSVAGDPVITAELVLAKPLGCAPRDTISWRLVRRSGKVLYLVPGYPGFPPPGALLPEDQMEFNASGVTGPRLASVRAAC